jgi:DNA-binding IclR family transcriptional regulator
MVLVVIKTFDILELVASRNGQPISLTEISDELQLNQATAANIIKTMVAKEYLEHIGKKKGYRLGPAAYRITNEVSYEQELLTAARDVMDELTGKLNESSILGVLRNNKRHILHVVNSNQEVQVQLRSDRNVYETASGRLLLAFLPEKQLESFLKQNGLPDRTLWKEGSSLKNLKQELEKIKKEGFVMTHLTNRHVRGFAVPVSAENKVVAGLSVFLPDYRYTTAKHKIIRQSLKEASYAISTRLQKGNNPSTLFY